MKTEQPDLATLKAGILNELDATCLVGGATYRQCFDMLEAQAARIAELEGAILWALGDGDSDFGDHQPDGPCPRYWWRNELRRRAALTPKPTV